MSKILVVDDEDSVRNMIKLILVREGYDVVEAINGEDALSKAQSDSFDLMITDLVMPEVNGIDLILKIKTACKNMPVLAISGGGGITGRFDYLPVAKLIGAGNILRKPFDMNELKQVVKDLVG